jgi:hypothetical protein
MERLKNRAYVLTGSQYHLLVRAQEANRSTAPGATPKRSLGVFSGLRGSPVQQVWPRHPEITEVVCQDS